MLLLLVIINSRTLEGAKKCAPKRIENANKDLLYYFIHLTCIFGGKKYKERSTGQRKQQRLDTGLDSVTCYVDVFNIGILYLLYKKWLLPSGGV